jgi:hypothetical protein
MLFAAFAERGGMPPDDTAAAREFIQAIVG